MSAKVIRRLARLASEAALTLAAVAGLCSIVVAGAALLLGVRPVVFLSGSMEPTIPTGSLALIETVDVERLRVGDVVSVERGHHLVTHRIAAMQMRGDGTAELTLKGDANPREDPRPDTVDEVGRVFWSVPDLGASVTELSRPQYVFAMGAAVGLAAARGLRRRARSDPPPQPEAGLVPASAGDAADGRALSLGLRVGGPASLLLLLGAVLVIGGTSQGTLAGSWTDAGQADVSATTSLISGVRNLDCAVTSPRTYTLTWDAPASGVRPELYRVSYSGALNGSIDVPEPQNSATVKASLSTLGTTAFTVSAHVGEHWHSTGSTVTATATSLLVNC